MALGVVVGVRIEGGYSRRAVRRRARARDVLLASTALTALTLALPAAGQNATWLTNPASNDFNASGNWSPNSVPTGTATFDGSNVTSLTFSNDTAVGGFTFNPGAANYNFTNDFFLDFDGTGITVNGGSATITNNFVMTFLNSSTAGGARITNNDTVEFHDTSKAGSAVITNSGGVGFFGASSAQDATITTKAFSVVMFFDQSTGGTARVITEKDGITDFSFSSGTNGVMSVGSIEGAGDYTIGGSHDRFVVGSNNLSTTVSGTIVECGCLASSLTKVGTGTLTLTAANDYTGGTTISAGAIAIGNTLALGTGAVTLDGGALKAAANNLSFGNEIRINTTGGTIDTGSNTFTIAGNIVNGNGAGALVKSGTGTLVLTNANSYSGGTTLQQGTLRLENDDALGSGALTTLGSTVDYAAGVSIGNQIRLNSNTTKLNVDTGSATQSGVISQLNGSRPLEKTGLGELILTGTNTYTGATTISAGKLTVFGGSALSNTARVTVANGATLNVANSETVGSLGGVIGSTVTLGNSILTVGGDNSTSTFAGVISGDGALVKQGTGALTLSGNNTFTAGITLAAGTLTLAHNSAAGTGVITTTGSVLGYANNVTIGNTVVIGSNKTQLQVLAGTARQTGAILQDASPRPLEKIGAGTLVVSSVNNSGKTTISQGTWRAGAASAFSAQSAHVVAAGATLDLGGFSQTINSLAGAGNVTSSAAGAVTLKLGTIGVTTASTVFSGSIRNGSGQLGLEVHTSGKFTLSGANSYTGDTLICDCSTLQLGNGGTTGSITSKVINNGTLIFNRSNTYNFAFAIEQGLGSPGKVVQAGSGVTVLSGNNSYAGGTTITAGTLRVANANSVGTGAVTMNGGTFQAGANVEIANAFGINTRGGTIDTNNRTLTLSGIIGNGNGATGVLTKTGAGTLVLAGNNTYTGGTILRQGTLRTRGQQRTRQR